MKAKAKKILTGLAAAFTSPTAVKGEKVAAVFVVTRVVIGLGGTAATADLIVKALHAFGF